MQILQNQNNLTKEKSGVILSKSHLLQVEKQLPTRIKINQKIQMVLRLKSTPQLNQKFMF